MNDNVRIKHGYECFEVSAAQCGKERVNHFSLLRDTRSRSRPAPDTAAGAACQLARRGGSASDDGSNLIEREIEHIVQHKCEAFCRGQTIEHHHQCERQAQQGEVVA